MADIFVSYAEEDRERVRALVDILTDQGWSVWWDRNLVAGPSFEEKIEEALDQASCVIVAWSEHSVKSRWCRAEATEGLERDVLVPLRLDESRPPLSFRAAHTASLVDWPRNAGELDAVLSGVRQCLGQATQLEQAVPSPAVKERNKAVYWTTALAALVVAGVLVFWTSERRTSVDPLPAEQKPKLAILRLEDRSPTGELGWLTGGLAEELSDQIAQWRRFQVLPRALVEGREPSELASMVDWLIDGSVAFDSDRLIVNVEVVDTRAGDIRFQDSIAGSLDDPIRLQRQIAANIARVFNEGVVDVSGLGPESDAAYRAYLNYRNVGTYGDIDQEVYWLKLGLDLEPTWAEGWGLLVGRYVQLYMWVGDEEQLKLAREAMRKATNLEPESPFLGYQWAILRAYGEGDMPATLETARGYAKAGSPMLYYWLMLNAGLFREAERSLTAHVTEQPYDQPAWEVLLASRTALEDRRGALAAIEQLDLLNPADAYVADLVAGIYETRLGQTDSARERLARLQRRLDAAVETSASKRALEFASRWVAVSIAMAEADASRLEDYLAEFLAEGLNAQAAWLAFQLDDPRTEEIIALAEQDPPFVLWSWFNNLSGLTPEQRTHPLVRRLNRSLGITPEWRLALCKDAATMPSYTHIKCDPSDYETRENPKAAWRGTTHKL